MKNRRNLLIVLGATALAPRAVLAQAKQTPVLIGWLHSESRESSGRRLIEFKEGLATLGWKEGPQVVFEERWADGRQNRLQSLAEEIAARKPVVIVAAPLRSVAAAAKAAPNTPIVIANGDDPVAAGLVKNLARPGGMITGLTNFTVNVMEKHLELLLAAAPNVRRVGFLADPNNANRALVREAVRRSAAQYSVEVRFSEVANPEDVEPAISNLAKEGAQALVVMPGSTLIVERQRIVKFALAQRWPTVAGPRSWAEAGIMLSYGAQVGVNFKRAAYYVDRILKGAKPGDLPIEQPTRFELVVNMKTAKTLGIKIPNSIMVQATKVIE